jgi:polyhydroxyalkanoate synthesis regulator phasin
MRDELRRLALFTSGVAELTRNRAEQIVRDLVGSGDLGRDQAAGVVKELLRRSAENRKELTRFVRSEIRNQIEALGLASKRDVERLERRVARLEAGGKKKTTRKKASAAQAGGTKSRGSRGAGSENRVKKTVDERESR